MLIAAICCPHKGQHCLGYEDFCRYQAVSLRFLKLVPSRLSGHSQGTVGRLLDRIKMRLYMSPLRILWWFLDMYCKSWIGLARPSRFELCTNRNLSWKDSHHSLCSLSRRNGKQFGQISSFLLMILRFLKFRRPHSFCTGNVSPYLSIHSNRCNTYHYKPLRHTESCQRRQQTDSRLAVEPLLDFQTLRQSDCQNYGFPYR